MTASIYHFYMNLVRQREHFRTVSKLEKFPFDPSLLSCQLEGVFPDMAIRLSGEAPPFAGGELIELKDSRSGYSISSFNSTIPCGRKNIADLIGNERSAMRSQMEQSGDDIYSLPIREVFYLVRGKSKENFKVCLVHGWFFETIKNIDLIRGSFNQAIEQAASENNVFLSDEEKEKFLQIFSEQKYFSSVRNVKKSSVSLRFRVMTEAKAEGNILNSRKYPEIKDNTLNLAIPFHDENEYNTIINAARKASLTEVEGLSICRIKHHFNGPFIVFQISF